MLGISKDKKATRRDILSLAPALVVSTALPAAAASENPFEKVRRLGNELSAALAEAGEIEYAYVRPAGVEFPVLLANRSDPGHLAKFYLREYEEAVSSGEVANKKVHIRTLSHIISDMMQGLEGYDYVIIQPANAGQWPVGVQSKVHVPT